MVDLSVIVSYYKQFESLKLVLKSLEQQSHKSFEVIIAEDDNSTELQNFISENQKYFSFKITHINQELKNGFMKTKILNKAITIASADKIAVIDGDCIAHRHLVSQYVKHIKPNIVCIGRSVNLSEALTKKLYQNNSLQLLNIFNLIKTKCSMIKDSIYSPYFSLTIRPAGLLGRNFGVYKKDILEINGFDEDYIYYGMEDVDLEWRLLKNNVTKKSVKNKAIVYHVYHTRGYTSKETELMNKELLKSKQQIGKAKCVNGIVKLT